MAKVFAKYEGKIFVSTLLGIKIESYDLKSRI